MEKIQVLNIDSTAFLIGKGKAAVHAAIRAGHIKTIYYLIFGTDSVPLLPLDEVNGYWNYTIDDGAWKLERFKIVARDRVVVTTTISNYKKKSGEIELEVFAGKIGSMTAEERKELMSE